MMEMFSLDLAYLEWFKSNGWIKWYGSQNWGENDKEIKSGAGSLVALNPDGNDSGFRRLLKLRI